MDLEAATSWEGDGAIGSQVSIDWQDEVASLAFEGVDKSIVRILTIQRHVLQFWKNFKVKNLG